MNIIIRVIIIVAAIIFFFFLIGIRIVRPTHRGLIETLGKYTGYAQPGFHWVFVFIQKLYRVDIREQLVNAEPQVIITNDNLNATVDAQVYLKINTCLLYTSDAADDLTRVDVGG